MRILEKLRLAWLRFRMRDVPFPQDRPEGNREPLSPADLADLRRLDPDTDLYARASYELPTGEVRIQLTNIIIEHDGLHYRLVRVHGDTFKPLDGHEPPRELLARRRHSNTDFREDMLGVTLTEQYEGELRSIGVFGLYRDQATGTPPPDAASTTAPSSSR
ncbi:MAG: hypothetical protein ACK4FG_00485 [Brevundimonas sp.]